MHKTRYHFLEETTSTNDEARNPRYEHGDAICAERQTAGRGQRGHTWSSEEGRNLMFSLVWEPRFLPVSEQFLLSEAVALALTDLFGGYGIDARIKWTNDIYAGDRKLVGILIEHNLTGDRLSRTIVGIGVNVNQTRFDPSLPNPSSMRLETGCEYDRQEVLHRLGDCLAAGTNNSRKGIGRRCRPTTGGGCTGSESGIGTVIPTAGRWRPCCGACALRGSCWWSCPTAVPKGTCSGR